LGECNANIAYELGRLHLVSPDQFVGGDCWRWISVNLEYLLYIGFDYDLQLTRH
jgi:hypothetical protein